VDAGANVGYFTWLAARCVGRRGRVLAAEPSPVAFARLADSVRANGLTQVSVHPVGLSDAPGEAVLYVPPAAHGNHSPTMAPAEDWDPIRVPVTTLEALLDREGIDQVDLLKLDVEGHEPRVLAGLGPGLRDGRVRAVLCEFNDYWLRLSGSSPAALWETLTSAGFAPPPGRRPSSLPPGCVVTLFLSHRG
jgi:FkbM family methyltransferase